MLTLLMLELVTSSLIFLALPLLLVILVMPDLIGSAASWPGFGTVYTLTAAHMKLSTIFFGVALPDLAMTVLVAALERRPAMLFFAGLFPVLRVIDSAIGLWAIPLTFRSKSNGRWKSPARQVSPVSLEPLVPLPPELAATQPIPMVRPPASSMSPAEIEELVSPRYVRDGSNASR
jgi:hypothetical protein